MFIISSTFQVYADLEYLVTTPGGTNYEATQLNIESLWSGGPLPSFASFVDILVGHVKDYQDRLLPESAVGYFSG